MRARINVLSEVPALWAAEVRRWRMIARHWTRDVDGRAAPDRNDEYLLYQTLVGAWPARDEDEALESFAERIRAYMEKATKEAKRHTSWINPDAAYDEAVRDFVTGLLARGGPFVEAVRPFQRLVALHGAVNSLAQTLLKIVSPGVPDFYQGSELWDLSLVDPDNRRPVDFAARRALLDELRARLPQAPVDLTELCAELLQGWPDGRVKLYLTHRALTLRRARPRLFGAGAYLALTPAGERADHVIALARRDGPDAAVAAVPRLTARLTGLSGRLPLGPEIWGDTWISLGDAELHGVYRDRFSGLRLETESRDGVPALAARALFAVFPGALLEREAPEATTASCPFPPTPTC